MYITIDQLDGSTDTITDRGSDDQIRLGGGIQVPRFQESCHPSDLNTRGLEAMTNASLQRGRQG